VTLGADLALALGIWGQPGNLAAGVSHAPWLLEFRHAWMPSLGIGFFFALDGLSLLMVLLTLFLGMISVAISWTEIQERVGFFHFNLLWTLAGIIGVFTALDLFLFYFFWELMLIPMFFLIVIWGHENRVYAAIKFFLFTQLSSLLMLLAIVVLYFVHGKATGDYTFDYTRLLGTPVSGNLALFLMLGFGGAFAVKLPVFPFHTWLPDAHTEAPTAGSVVLAGLLLKTGAYGMLRFVVPLFPEAAVRVAPFAMALGVAGILYGAVLAFSQRDFKRLVAYTSVSHMGFVILGVFAWNELALQGCGDADALSRSGDGRSVHSGGGSSGTHPHARSFRDGGIVGGGPPDGRRRAGLCLGVARPAGVWQLCGGVPDSAGRVEGLPVVDGPGLRGPYRLGGLCPSDCSERFFHGTNEKKTGVFRLCYAKWS
jgi:NADH-quinone oxidoreductase subunit M